VANGPAPVGRYGHAVTMVNSKLFVFGGQVDGEFLNDMWGFDLNSRTFAHRQFQVVLISISVVKSKPFWESYEPAPGSERPPRRTGHASVTHGDHIIMFVAPLSIVSFLSQRIVDSVVPTVYITITILGCSTFRHESGQSYNVLATFRLPVKVTLLPSWMTLCMSLVGVASTEPI
jgi:hypothetical protein